MICNPFHYTVRNNVFIHVALPDTSRRHRQAAH
jgi:hypothetical protein